LAIVIDLYARRVVGGSLSSRIEAQLVCDALTMAIWQRKFSPNLIDRRDRGYQYASGQCRKLLAKNRFRGTMGRKGNCWDTAVIASFFGSLKQERVQWKNYQNSHEAQQDILNYITVL